MRGPAGAADDRRLALAGAVALHLGVLGLFLLRPANPLVPMGTAVPVTILAHDPTTDSRPAVAAPVTQAASAPEPAPPQPAAAPPPPPPQPTPQRRIEPAPPPPRPIPAPAKTLAKPQPSPKPAPSPAKPAPPTAKPQARPTPKTDTFNLDAIAADVAKSARRAPARPAAAARGPAQAETAPQARVDAGRGVSQSDIAGLSQLLNRLWNKSCNLDEDANITVSFTVGDDGRLVGRPDANGADRSSNPAIAIAARRAIDAVREVEPYAAPYRRQGLKVIFDAKKACANG